jgi:hypothetical protein
MLTPQQTEIFLTNIGDFLLTRGMFYSQKTYPGLEEFDNDLGETIIGKDLLSQEAWEQWECQKLPGIRETLWKELSSIIRESRLTKNFIKTEWPYIERYFNCQLVCGYDAKQHIFHCLKTWKEINDFIQNLDRIDLEFSRAYNDKICSSAWQEQQEEVRRRWNRMTPNKRNSPAPVSPSNLEKALPVNYQENNQDHSTKTNAISSTEQQTERATSQTSNQIFSEENSSKSKAFLNSSPGTAKFLLGLGLISLLLITIIILRNRKKSKIKVK